MEREEEDLRTNRHAGAKDVRNGHSSRRSPNADHCWPWPTCVSLLNSSNCLHGDGIKRNLHDYTLQLARVLICLDLETSR